MMLFPSEDHEKNSYFHQTIIKKIVKCLSKDCQNDAVSVKKFAISVKRLQKNLYFFLRITKKTIFIRRLQERDYFHQRFVKKTQSLSKDCQNASVSVKGSQIRCNFLKRIAKKMRFSLKHCKIDVIFVKKLWKIQNSPNTVDMSMFYMHLHLFFLFDLILTYFNFIEYDI